MDARTWIDWIKGFWTVVGSFVGLVYGHHLATGWQRKQWALDNRRQEYRELLGTLSRSALFILRNNPQLGFAILDINTTPDILRKCNDADIEARTVIQDRVFIARMIRDEGLLERWQLLVAKREGSEFLNSWRDLHAALVKTACDELGL